jgi:H+/gluconate symporter-like permease
MFTKATLGLAVILVTASGAAATKTHNVDPSHPAYTNVYNPFGADVGTDPDINVRLWEREE